MSTCNKNVWDRQGLVLLSDCQGCQSYSSLDSQSGLGKKGFKGLCLLGKSGSQPSLAELKKVPCMDRELVNTRRQELSQ